MKTTKLGVRPALAALAVSLACTSMAFAMNPSETRYRFRDVEPDFQHSRFGQYKGPSTDRLIVKYKNNSKSTGKSGYVLQSK